MLSSSYGETGVWTGSRVGDLTVEGKIHTTLPMPAKIGQIDGIQVLRAVAVFLVAWFHSGEPIEGTHSRNLPDFGVFGVDIFFVISGFIMATILLRPTLAPGPAAAWYFLKRRLVRIFPIYWVFAAVVAMRMLRDHVLTADYLPAVFLAPALTFPHFSLIVPFSWTLIFEMVFYYIVAAMLFATTRHAVGVTVAFICGAVTLGAVFGVRYPVAIIALNPMLLEFVLGMVVALVYQRFGRRRMAGVAVLGAGVALSFYLRAFPPHAADGMHMVLAGKLVLQRAITWGVAAALIVGGMVFWSPSMKSRAGQFAVVLGNSSYSAYLVSGLVLEFVSRLLLKVSHAGAESSVETMIGLRMIVVVSVFLLGWLCYQFIEWPMIRRLGKMIAR